MYDCTLSPRLILTAHAMFVNWTMRLELLQEPQASLTMRERVFRWRFGSRGEGDRLPSPLFNAFEYCCGELFDGRTAQEFTGAERHSGLFFRSSEKAQSR